MDQEDLRKTAIIFATSIPPMDGLNGNNTNLQSHLSVELPVRRYGQLTTE